MTTQTPAYAAPLTQQAQLLQLANRQRLLLREAQDRAIAKAVAKALKS